MYEDVWPSLTQHVGLTLEDIKIAVRQVMGEARDLNPHRVIPEHLPYKARYNFAEVAFILGYDHESTIRGLVRAGKLRSTGERNCKQFVDQRELIRYMKASGMHVPWWLQQQKGSA